MDGHGMPANSPIPHASHLHDPGLPALGYDPARANALLDQAGYPRGANGVRFRLRLDPSPTQTVFAPLGDYMKQAFAAVGIGIDIRVADLVTRNRWVYTDYDFDMTILSLGCIVDPVVSVINCYWSKGIQKGVVLANVGDYRSAEMDTVIEAARVELDEVKRVALFHRFQQIAVADMALLPIIDNDSYNVFSTKVRGHSVTPLYPIDNWADAWLAK
jgi:peptide/nickel transport system substrate-binding protein